MQTKLTLQKDIDKLEEARTLLHEMADAYEIPLSMVTLVTEPMWKVVNRVVVEEK